MFTTIIAIFLNASLVFSTDIATPCGAALALQIGQFDMFELSFNAVSADNVKNANCIRTIALTDQEISEWLSKNKSEKELASEVDALLPSYKKDKNCKDSMCMVEASFGKKEGLRLLYLKARYGFNGSHFKYDNAKEWTPEELDQALLSLGDFPQSLFPITENYKMIRANSNLRSSSNSSANKTRTMANSSMEFFNEWSYRDDSTKRTTVLHEVAHVISIKSDLAMSNKWLELSDWERSEELSTNGKTRIVFSSNNTEGHVSEYAMDDPEEDLAESIEAFRYNPQLLKSNNEDKYNFIRDYIFDGKSFLTSSECEKSLTSPTSSEIEKMKVQFKNWTPSFSEVKNITQNCQQVLMSELSEHQSIDIKNSTNYSECLDSSLEEYLREELLLKLKQEHGLDLRHLTKNLNLKPLFDEELKNAKSQIISNQKENLKSHLSEGLKKLQGIKVFRPTIDCNLIQGKNPYLYFSNDYFKEERRDYADQYSNVSKMICNQMKEKRSLKDKFNFLDFSDSEIKRLLDSIIE